MILVISATDREHKCILSFMWSACINRMKESNNHYHIWLLYMTIKMEDTHTKYQRKNTEKNKGCHVGQCSQTESGILPYLHM